MAESMLDYDWHHHILEENRDKLIESLGNEGAKVIQIDKTDKGYKFVECCDSYYGVTLSQEQFERLIRELQELAGLTDR